MVGDTEQAWAGALGTGAEDTLDAVWLAQLPKVELHVHLEGTISAATASTLARNHGQDPQDVLELVNGDYPRRYRDFNHFVDTFVATSRQLRTPDDLVAVTEAFARQQADQNVVWSEATITALALVEHGFAADELWAALNEGLARVPETQVGFIVDTVRELGPDAGHRTVELVSHADAPIVAFGLTGIEGSRPEGDFRMLREAADRLGLGLVVHAGETGTADNVWAALDDLGADRIGHGIAAIHDRALVERLAAEATVLEVCPSSNVTLGLAPSLAEHPLPQLLDAGIAVTINSDDPPFFATTLTDELRHASAIANLDATAMIALQQRAIEASFAPAEIRQSMQDRLPTVQ